MTGLPVFPTDDSTLIQLEHALNTSIEITDEGERRCVGGEFTLPKLLDFLSGYDPERATLTGYIDGVPVYEAWDARYSEHDVIRALVARVRALEAERDECADLRREVEVLTAERDAALYARDTAAAQKHSGGTA